MKEFHCPYCGQSAFATLCTDCQAEGIRIQKVKSVFHVGQCHRCGHVDDEPCLARTGSRRALVRAWQEGNRALSEIRDLALRIAARAAEALKGSSARTQ